MFKKIIFSLIPIVIFFAILEIVLAIIGLHRAPFQNRHKRTNPAYTKTPWYTEDFYNAGKELKIKHITPKGTTLLFPIDCQNKYISILRGVRKTTGFRWELGNPPPVKIFVLGGSTTVSTEVPDEYTWPSILQKMIVNKAKINNAKIFNYGVSSVCSSQELERLIFEIKQGNMPDICIFLNGDNDVGQGVFNERPEGVMSEEEIRYNKRWSTKILRRINLARIIMLEMDKRTVPKHLLNNENITKLAQKTATFYESNMREAGTICKKYGISMYVFLQPNMYTIRRPLNKYEMTVSNRSRKGMKRCFDAAYPLIRKKIDTLKADGLNAYDLSDIFDKNSKPIFLDPFHVSSGGNEIIAENIFKHIKKDITMISKASKTE